MQVGEVAGMPLGKPMRAIMPEQQGLAAAGRS
jgi:hypothetical protein